jgi:flagellar biosynthesis protein FlhF
MRIKRVEAESTADALRLLRAELGENALILSTRTLEGPPRRRVEVVGAVDDPRQPPGPGPLRGAPLSGPLAGGDTELAWPVLDVRHVVCAPSPWDRASRRARRIAFVGPTGAGKTTTLAKVAARARLEHRRRVSLVTIDTYRIGAVPQLASYAQILGVPLTVANSPADLAAALDGAHEADLVYIDTVGRSPFGPGIEGLAPFLERAAADDVCLVLSATTRPSDCLSAAARYARLGPTRLCITKLDETDDRSALPAVSHATRLPLTWLGVGQEVPDDLEEAEPGRLAALLAGGRAA